MSLLKNIINIIKFRLNFFKVNKTCFYLNFFKVIIINSYSNFFKDIITDFFLNFFKITEFYNSVKFARFLQFMKKEFELLNSSVTEDKKSLKDILKSLK